jgi:hypothetical protein
MSTLEQITYDAGRHALADQEAFVAGIRQRTGTLLAAHALVASFLGGAVLRDGASSASTWVALTALVAGLIVAAILLAPWRLRFAVDTRDLYRELRSASIESDAHGHLAGAGFAYQKLYTSNMARTRRMSSLLGAMAILMVAQTLFWLTALVIG